MTELTAKSVIDRYRKAKERRSVWEQHWRFSCWNEADPNRVKILAVDKDNRNFASCLRIARRAVNGTLPDPTGGATHYHNHFVNPPWARGRAACFELGRHLFYSNVE